MKFILRIFIASLFIPMISAGQGKVTLENLSEIMTLRQQGKPNKALARIRALRDSVTVRDSLYVYMILTSAELNGRLYNCEEAIKDNEEIIKLSPSSEVNAQTYIGQFKRVMGDFDGAIAAYTRVLKLDKKNTSAYNNLANAYNSAGRYRDAIGILDSDHNPNRPMGEYYQYSMAYFNLNKLDSAKLCINRYLMDSESLNDFNANKLAARICEGLGFKKISCEFITTAIDIITEAKAEERIGQAPAKTKGYYYFKEMIKDIKEAKELKAKVCK
jgi:tetratricopeptide (TPR) repeat protein